MNKLGLRCCVAWLGLLAALGAEGAEPLVLEGYCDPLSVRPGEEVRFHISTNAKQYGLDVYRVGWRDELAYRKDGIPGSEHPAGEDTGKPGQASKRSSPREGTVPSSAATPAAGRSASRSRAARWCATSGTLKTTRSSARATAGS